MLGPGTGTGSTGFGLHTGSVTALYILQNGKIGIGTTSPQSGLDIQGDFGTYFSISANSISRTFFQMIDTNAGGKTWIYGPGTGTGDNSGIGLYNLTDAKLAYFIKNNGNVGIGTTNPQEKLDVAGNIKAEGLIGPPRMMLASASFSIAAGQDTGSASFAAGDGIMEARTGTTANSIDDTLGGITDFNNLLQNDGIARNLNVSGAFLSAHARWTNDTSATNRLFYLLGGGVGNNAGVGELLRNGFGFKAEGNTLFGVLRLNGSETTQSLGVTLSPGTFVELHAACRGSSSVQFYVDGVLKATVTATMPSTAASTYEVQVTNGASGGEAALQVGYLTVGFPM